MSQTGSVTVHRFQEADAPALAALLVEMVGFYDAAVAPGLRVEEDVVRQAATLDIIVARVAGRMVGFASFTSLYPVAGLLAFTYVQQVYVAEQARRHGVAWALMAAIAQAAKARGESRVEWSTSAGNAAARALYEALGATGSEKIHFILEGDAFDRMAAGSA